MTQQPSAEEDAGLAEARKIIDDTFAFANQKRESGRSSMPITLDDVYALVAFASLGVDCVTRVEQWSLAAALHAPTRAYPEVRFAPWCDECSQGYTAGGDDPPGRRTVSWPCRTARALGLVDPLATTVTSPGAEGTS